MAATSSPKAALDGAKLLDQLAALVPGISYEAGKTFLWSPKRQTVHYAPVRLKQDSGCYALLHETGHAQLGHTTYKNDFELLQMEVGAWEMAKATAKQLGITIDQNHIEDCLDTYRDWLHRRSSCPSCGLTALQIESGTYHCHNCNTDWHVSTARFCRPYRRLAL